MTRLVSAELLKLRTTRTAFGFLVATVLLTLAIEAASLATGSFSTKSDLEFVLSGAGVTSGLLLVLGIVGTTGEYRHGTITSSLLTTPDRRRFLVAKLLGFLVAGALLGAAAMATTYLIAIPWLSIKDAPLDLLGAGDYVGLFARGIALAALSGALGVAIGTIVRNQVAAVVGTLVYLFVLEPAVVLLSEDVFKYTIGGAQGALGGGDTGSDELAPGLAALVLAGWTLALAAIGVVVEERRDVT